MADWYFIPSYVYTTEREPARVLISRFEDGSEIRRVKSTTNLRRFTEKFSVGRHDLSIMMGFWNGQLTNGTFTKWDWDFGQSEVKGLANTSGQDNTTVGAAPAVRGGWKVNDILRIESSGGGSSGQPYPSGTKQWDGFHYASVNSTSEGAFISTNTTMSYSTNATIYRHSYENDVTVRFAKEPAIDQVAMNRWHITWEFAEVA